jgi:hypothetical protein
VIFWGQRCQDSTTKRSSENGDFSGTDLPRQHNQAKFRKLFDILKQNKTEVHVDIHFQVKTRVNFCVFGYFRRGRGRTV